MLSPDFWQDQRGAKKVLNKAKSLKDIIQDVDALQKGYADNKLMLDLILEDKDGDISAFKDLAIDVVTLEKQLMAFEVKLLLSSPYDKADAILELHPGAGGVESQDWAEMLLRMYTRWSEKRGYTVEVLDYLAGEEAGLKSVTLLVKGTNAYGYLKSEKGVHRLVRISPFDSSGRRHTSFASVQAMPEIETDVEIQIKSDDIKVDTYRASGAGGQHVNTTDSAVRITHIPTGTVATCQSERSQLKNRERAMKILRARLVAKKIEEKQQELSALKGEQSEIGWGNQIRSYVLHPYSMVKDHRTQIEVGNVQAVMDGEIQIFIEGYLRSQV